jgi:hypothetical protein
MGNPYQDTAIDRAFLAFCHDHGLTVFVRGVDKHGSITWEAAKRGALTRYLMLAGTEILTDAGRRVQMNIAIGADDGFHFTHREQSSWQLSMDQFLSRAAPVSHAATAPPNGKLHVRTADSDEELRRQLPTAWKNARALGSDDLHDEYIVPRNEQWQDAAAR